MKNRTVGARHAWPPARPRAQHTDYHTPPVTLHEPERFRFRRQWVILRKEDSLSFSWPCHSFPSGEQLFWHPDLPVEISDVMEDVIVILGMLIDLPHDHDHGSAELLTGEAKLMHRLSRAAGTYAVIRGQGNGVRIYTDAAAMMGVYHHDGRASSSPSLLPGLERDPVIDAEYSLGDRNEWFTGSVCPFKGVRFLPANHHLDLHTGQTARFWPGARPLRDDRSDGLSRCATLFRDTVEQVSRRGRMIASLTGGRDSRVNLAASRRILERVQFFTVRDERTPPGDGKVPAIFSRRFPEMKHTFIDRRPDEPSLTRLYDEISAGLAVGARRGMLAACLDASHWGEIHLSGSLGEVARGYFWHTRHPKSVRLDTVLAKFGNPAPCIRQGLEEWLASVPPELSPAMIYNLLYLEQRGGRWAGVGENAAALFYHPFSAFNSRPFFEALASVPEHLQYGDHLSVALIAEMWPELLDLPFCHSGNRLSPLVPKWIKHTVKRFLS